MNWKEERHQLMDALARTPRLEAKAALKRMDGAVQRVSVQVGGSRQKLLDLVRADTSPATQASHADVVVHQSWPKTGGREALMLSLLHSGSPRDAHTTCMRIYDEKIGGLFANSAACARILVPDEFKDADTLPDQNVPSFCSIPTAPLGQDGRVDSKNLAELLRFTGVGKNMLPLRIHGSTYDGCPTAFAWEMLLVKLGTCVTDQELLSEEVGPADIVYDALLRSQRLQKMDIRLGVQMDCEGLLGRESMLTKKLCDEQTLILPEKLTSKKQTRRELIQHMTS